MRAGNKPEWLIIDGKVVGINLGADYCAEHEWGIKGLRWVLRMDGALPQYSREKPIFKKPHGIARRMISAHERVKLYENGKKEAILICWDEYAHQRFTENLEKHGSSKAFKENLPHGLRGELDRDLRAAWDGDSFGIRAKGDQITHLKNLAQAFETNNVAIWIGGASLPVFENGGLILCIVNRVEEKYKKILADYDLDSERLTQASDATGIIKRLDDAKKGYFACSPKWLGNFKPGGKTPKTAHPVIYWLNPVEQQENNYGWFTVEDLDQWIKGEGPVPMKASVQR